MRPGVTTIQDSEAGLRTGQWEMSVNFDKGNFLSWLRRWGFIAQKNVDYASWCCKRIRKGCDVASAGDEFKIPPTRGTWNGVELSQKCVFF